MIRSVHAATVRSIRRQDGDETVVYDSMQALLTLEKLHGLFPRIVGKGDYAAVRCVLHALETNTKALPTATGESSLAEYTTSFYCCDA